MQLAHSKKVKIPKVGDKYWTICITDNNEPWAIQATWLGDRVDVKRAAAGLIFPNKSKAIEANNKRKHSKN